MRDEAEKLQIRLIYNASYSPDYNAVEGVIGLAKDHIKRQRWLSVANQTSCEDDKLIKEAFKRIKIS